MNASCSQVRRTLETETGGVTGDVRAHLAACAACRSHAALLELLDRAAPAADEAAVKRILSALRRSRWQWRAPTTWLPLAAGLVLVTCGLLLLGGVPAPAAVASLPATAGGFVGGLLAWTLDAIAAAHGGSDAVRTLSAAGGAWFLLWLTIAMLGGGWAVLALVGRRRVGVGS